MAVQMKSILEDVDIIYKLIESGDTTAVKRFRSIPSDIRRCLKDRHHINSYLVWDATTSFVFTHTNRKYNPHEYYSGDQDTRSHHFYKALFTKMLENNPRVDLSVWCK